jgi:isopentenyl diphosphate isomerase/L-lactate dehydrogenase-like FMN-dependent dehydrogenase
LPIYDTCYNIEELRDAAKKRLPKWIFDFIDGGTEDFNTLKRNREVFKHVKLMSRALVDMKGRDLSTDLLGGRVPMPVAIGPTGSAGLCWYEGELEMARAAAKFGIPYTMAVGSITRIERIAEAGGRLWLQLYIWENRDFTREMINRGRDASYEALVVTADYGIGNNREYNYRNRYSMPFKITPRTTFQVAMRPDWMLRTFAKYFFTVGIPRQANNPTSAANIHNRELVSKDGAGHWGDIVWLRDMWKGKLIIKGILHPEDAETAVKLGADAIVVSSHGGRGLDSSITPIEALPSIVAAVGNKTTILFDSGVRRGSDILKAKALGAKAILLGRATLGGNAVGGEAGTLRALNLLRREYEQTMGFVGKLRSDNIDRSVIAGDPPPIGFKI